MGESREGRGAEHSAATDRVARALALDAIKSERELAQCTVQRVTAGLYTVECFFHGEPEAERFLYAEADLVAAEGDVTPPLGDAWKEVDG